AAIARMWWDEPAAVRDTYEKLAEHGRQLGDEGSLAYVYVMLAQADILLGELDRAEADAAAARDIAEQGGQETLVAYALAVRAMVDAHRGLDAAHASAELALELGRRTQGTPALHFATAALGLLEISAGRAEEAVAVLAPLVEFARTEHIREPGLTRYVIDQVEALIELARAGDAAGARGGGGCWMGTRRTPDGWAAIAASPHRGVVGDCSLRRTGESTTPSTLSGEHWRSTTRFRFPLTGREPCSRSGRPSDERKARPTHAGRSRKRPPSSTAWVLWPSRGVRGPRWSESAGGRPRKADSQPRSGRSQSSSPKAGRTRRSLPRSSCR